MVLEQVTFLEFTRKYVTCEEGGKKGADRWERRKTQIIQDLVFTQGEQRGHCGWLVKNRVWRGKCRYARPVRHRVWSESKRMKMTWVRKQILLCLLFIL